MTKTAFVTLSLLAACRTVPELENARKDESAKPTPPVGASPQATAGRYTPTADDLKVLADTLAASKLEGKGDLTATITTEFGKTDCVLFEDKAPLTVANFVGLAQGTKEWTEPGGKKVTRPLYDGTTFHRVVKGFMIQGGDPAGNGTGSPGFKIKDEVWDGATHDRAGLLCMANAGPNTNGSQFFITDDAAKQLDGYKTYTIFGQCNPEVVHKIAAVPVSMSPNGEMSIPNSKIVIQSIRVKRVPRP